MCSAQIWTGHCQILNIPILIISETILHFLLSVDTRCSVYCVGCKNLMTTSTELCVSFCCYIDFCSTDMYGLSSGYHSVVSYICLLQWNFHVCLYKTAILLHKFIYLCSTVRGKFDWENRWGFKIILPASSSEP